MEGTGMLHLFRLIHIVAGVLWVGAAVFVGFFLMPTVRSLGPAGGPVMQQLAQVRKLPVYMMSMAFLTILSGIGLYWRDSGGFSGPWMRTGSGVVFGFGGLLGILVVTLGMAIVSPGAKRMGALAAAMHGSGGPPAPAQVAEMQALQARMARFAVIVAVLLLLATAAMAVARYVP
jgi:hypothetical protein